MDAQLCFDQPEEAANRIAELEVLVDDLREDLNQAEAVLVAVRHSHNYTLSTVSEVLNYFITNGYDSEMCAYCLQNLNLTRNLK